MENQLKLLQKVGCAFGMLDATIPVSDTDLRYRLLDMLQDMFAYEDDDYQVVRGQMMDTWFETQDELSKLYRNELSKKREASLCMLKSLIPHVVDGKLKRSARAGGHPVCAECDAREQRKQQMAKLIDELVSDVKKSEDASADDWHSRFHPAPEIVFARVVEKQ